MSFELTVDIEVPNELVFKAVVFPFEGAFSFISLEVISMEAMRLILFSAHPMEFVVQKVSLIEKVM